MELVWTHDAVDLVPPAIRVELGDGRPEAGDFQHHLGTVSEQELVVLGRLVVPPDVVEDGRIDVPLVVAEVPIPASRAWVKVDDLGLLLAVATTLPGVHRPQVTSVFRRRAGLVEAPVAIHQELARYLGQPEVEERVNVEFVPEDMAAVGFAVKAAGRHPSVQVSRVRRADLEYVGDVQANQKLDPTVLGYAQVAYGPELVPGPGVMVEGCGERFVADDRFYGIVQRLVYGVVARAV